MRLVVEVELGTPAMESPYEVIQAMENSMNADLWNIFRKGEQGKIYDSNMVLVGTWRIE